MSRFSKYESRRHYRPDPSSYKDSDRNRKPYRSRSRSKERHRPQSPTLLEAIMEGQISDTLEVLSKSCSHLRNNFKVRPKIVEDPYDFSVLPVFVNNNEINQLLNESAELRRKARLWKPDVTEHQFGVLMAELRASEVDARLKAIREELNKISE